LIQVPKFVEFVGAENAAAGMSRGLVERTDDWGRLVARAQRILAEVQNELTRAQIKFLADQFYDLEQGAPLIAAARILYAASQADSLEPSHRLRLALCSAAAFSMYGNFPSAYAVIKNTLQLSETLSSRIWLAIGCFSPRFLGEARIRAIETGDKLSSSAIEALQSYLVTGQSKQIYLIDQLILDSFATCEDNLENILLGYARVSLRHLQLLSTRESLSRFQSLPQAVIGQLIDAGIPTLLPSQFAVLCRSSLLRSSYNSLVCLPTSTGKTLIGELAIAAALSAKPGLAIYLAPYIAIGLQAARALKEHLPRPYRVHTLVGGLNPDPQIDTSRFPEVVVATPERFDSMLRRFNALQDLRIVVVDEAHVVSDGARGVRLEALLSRLRLQQESGRAFRIL
jgi:helicase